MYASNAARFEESYRTIAETVKAPHRHKPDAKMLQLVYNWLCDGANGRWIIILDNADDPNMFSNIHHERAKTDTGISGSQRNSLASFLPQSQHGSILITSRDRDTALRLTGKNAHIIKVEPMNESHALRLLQTKIDDDIAQDGALELLEALDYMPLAISQAAAYINNYAPRITLTKYLDQFRKSDKSKANLLNRDSGDLRRDCDVSNSVMVTWQLSFDYIHETRRSASRLLSLMSFFDRQGIKDSLVCNKYKEIDGETDTNIRLEDIDYEEVKLEFEKDVNKLKNYSLITVQGKDGKIFEMHRLVQFSTRKWLESHGVVEKWKERCIMLLDDEFPETDDTSWDDWKKRRAMFSHVEAMLAYGPAKDRCLAQWIATLHRAASFANSKEDHLVAQHIIEQALEVLEQTTNKEYLETLGLVNDLATTLAHQGKYEATRKFNQRAQEGREKALRKEHPDSLESLHGLASILQGEGNLQEAENVLQQVLEEYEKAGAEEKAKLKIMSHLSDVLYEQGKREATGNMINQVIDISLRVGDYPTFLHTLMQLVRIFRNQGDDEKATKFNRKAIEQSKKILGPKHLTTLLYTYNYACLLHASKQYDHAKALYDRVYGRYVKTLGPNNPDSLTCMYHKADILFLEKDYNQAGVLFRKAYAGLKKWYGGVCANSALQRMLLERAHRDEEIDTMKFFAISAAAGGEETGNGTWTTGQQLPPSQRESPPSLTLV